MAFSCRLVIVLEMFFFELLGKTFGSMKLLACLFNYAIVHIRGEGRFGVVGISVFVGTIVGENRSHLV